MSATLRPASDGAAPAPAPKLAPASAPDRRSEWVWLALLGLLLAGTAVLMFHLSRGLTFNLDEWTVVTDRRGPGAPSLLEPHNEHLSVLILGALLALLQIGGLDAQPLMMVPLVAMQLALGGLLFVIARRRVGAGVAVGVAALAMLSGLAYENFLVPGQAGQMASIVAGVGAFALLDLPRTRRTDLAIAGLLTAGLASSGMGIPILAGIVVELALSKEGRERLWVAAAPFGLYLVWYLAYGTNRAGFDELALSAVWAWTAANHAAGTIVGERQIEPGRDFLIVVLVILAWRAWRMQPPARIRMAALATVLVTFYGLTALSRHDIAPPSSSRYLTVGLVFLLLLLVEAGNGLRVRRWAPYVVIFLALLSFSKDNTLGFQEGRAILLDRSQRVLGSLGAVELLGRDRVDPTLEVAPLAAPLLEAGGWFGARDGLRGDPAYSATELPRAPAAARDSADDTLVRAGAIGVRPPGERPADCRPAWTGDSGTVPPGGVRIEASDAEPLHLRARRFGNTWVPVLVLALPAGRAVELAPLRDGASRPYVVQAPGAARTCVLDGR